MTGASNFKTIEGLPDIDNTQPFPSSHIYLVIEKHNEMEENTGKQWSICGVKGF